MPVMLLAEKLVGEARARRARTMEYRDRAIVLKIALLICAAATAVAIASSRVIASSMTRTSSRSSLPPT